MSGPVSGAVHLADEAALLAWGGQLAGGLRPGDRIALSGGLGAGKTTLARGILRGLGYAGEVPSPSFALLQGYEPPALRLPVAHVDLYRVAAADEIAELGLDEWLAQGVLIVEWAERLGPSFAAAALQIGLAQPAAGGRDLTAQAPAAWTGRWPLR